MKDKRKEYIVTIITRKNELEVSVKAENKKEAKKMVEDVLIKCNLFGFKLLNDFRLKCNRKMEKEVVEKMVSFMEKKGENK